MGMNCGSMFCDGGARLSARGYSLKSSCICCELRSSTLHLSRFAVAVLAALVLGTGSSVQAQYNLPANPTPQAPATRNQAPAKTVIQETQQQYLARARSAIEAAKPDYPAQQLQIQLTTPEQAQAIIWENSAKSAADDASDRVKALAKAYTNERGEKKKAFRDMGNGMLADKKQPLYLPSGQENPNNCPGEERPPISRIPGSTARRQVEGDYLVLEYNADPDSLQTRWYDYRQWYFKHNDPQWNNLDVAQRNGSFLPVVYAKEKILVHVCGLRFTDILTVTNNSTALPEGGADIRGGAVVTAVPTLAPALDSLQAIGATGEAATIGGLGFGATPALASAAVTGITNGTLQHTSSGLTYTDAAISASPQELALLMYALVKNSIQLTASINGDFRLTVDPAHADRFESYPPNQLNHVAVEAEQRFEEVTADSADSFRKNDAAEFDQDLTNVENLSSELTGFFSVLTSQGYGTRAVTLWNNYAILSGPLEMMAKSNRTNKTNCIPKSEVDATQKAAEKKLNAVPAGSTDREP
jgi:hypothetical protein